MDSENKKNTKIPNEEIIQETSENCVFCLNCGAPKTSWQTFCGSCGHNTKNTSIPKANNYPNDDVIPKKPNKALFMVLIGIVCVLVVVVAFLFGRMSGKDFEKQGNNIVKSVEKQESKSNKKTAELAASQFKNAEVGEYVTFGKYEQDDNHSNGKEDIEWLVLNKKDDKIFVISKYALDCKQYHVSFSNVTWETSELRKWLNNEFLDNAFSESEKNMISITSVKPHRNPEHDTSSGNSTRDKVFLLSIREVYKYFNSDSEGQCQPTAYAVATGAYKNDDGNCWWWLRSPGFIQGCAANFDCDEGVNVSGFDVTASDAGVRPALWIQMNS